MNETAMPEALANSLHTAVEAAHSMAAAAADVAAAAFIAAADGKGTPHRTWHGEGPDAWCAVTAPGFHAHLLRDTPGTRAQIHFTGLSQEAYERIRTRALESDECPHDDMCGCLAHPWPTWSELEKGADVPEIVDRTGEKNTGITGYAFGRAKVTLFEEPVELVYELIRRSRTTR
ncbi:hypothetical protein [Streptomyces qinglanensis]|uniref:hypothetical protein n=1 Tax=Streptomyces qinglanensis TaxID=943816 RepID=UPI003D74A7D5